MSLHHSHTALGVVSGDGSLDHIAIIGTKKQHGHDQSTILSILSIGAGLLPVGPHKLVNRSQSGEFLDMAELLPDHLGVSTTPKTREEDKQPLKSKKCQVVSILE